MRRLLLTVVILPLSVFGATAAPPLCALPSSKPPTTLVANPAVREPPQDSPAQAVRPPASPVEPPLASSLTKLPFLQHVVASGATLIDLGKSHGLHRVAAQTGDQFMIFEVLPDGSAAVSGPPVELSPAEISKAAGHGVTDMGTSHGSKCSMPRRTGSS